MMSNGRSGTAPMLATVCGGADYAAKARPFLGESRLQDRIRLDDSELF
jgi:hypothetical protein